MTVFGGYRIYLATRKAAPDDVPKKGLYRMSRRTHAMIGAVYLLLGAALVATTLGWNPFGDYFAVDTKTPPKEEAPSKTPVPVDQLPTKPDRK
ncbi:MAG: hypothetical protein M4D80_19965 [Myxococcota bacterium]|nr:hypothetical protein [Deltaproteobacteria bacterium]MDQ3337445.1 hypothetical protein [Myxococcota bacterium]